MILRLHTGNLAQLVSTELCLKCIAFCLIIYQQPKFISVMTLDYQVLRLLITEKNEPLSASIND